MKRALSLLFLIACATSFLHAQTRCYNPLDAEVPYVQGRAWNAEIGKSFNRFPPRAEANLRKPVWQLSTNSAGEYIKFYCNAPEIKIKYTVSGYLNLPNLTTIACSGVDLYVTDNHGKTDWCACPAKYRFGKPGDTITFRYTDLEYHNRHNRGSEYQLFLPLYNTVTSLCIEIPDTCELKFSPLPLERPIVVYGTSIAQGASGSRPAMAWTNIIQRRTQSPVINLGFSGNALMDAAVYDLLSEIDAQLFILDCMPNMYGVRDSIVSRTLAGVAKLRSKTAAPILLVENDGYMYGKTNAPIEKECNETNAELKKAYEQLKAQGVKNIYYLTKEEIGLTPDSQIDGWHANDIGMQEYADAYIKKINAILHRNVLPIFEPCVQRREPENYEWAERHNDIIRMNRSNNPEILMIGNSITHFWGGEPTAHRRSGEKSWQMLFGNKSVTNMGFGWDRIENVFWRIYHGELDDCSPKQICLMIGTNNLDFNTDDEIVTGICALADLIRERQPQTKLHVLCIYPRKNNETRIAKINSMLKSQLKTNANTDIIDLTKLLITKDGKIDESLFIDGLHPNEQGYARIANELKKTLK